MRIVADLHIHSRFSRATSKTMDIAQLDEWARKKGVTVLGTGDFTHPKWMEELERDLEPAEEGLYKRKGNDSPTRFLLTVEISCIYSKGGKVRKVHALLFAPSTEVAKQINSKLRKIGNIRSDGRPILGLDVKELAKIAFDVSDKCMVVPAHAWTPWFSVFGSKSGFDSLEECFEEITPHIYAIESGLSSDPAMNWRISALDSIAILSNSDCHSSANIARECNVFDTKLSYTAIMNAIKTKDPKKFLHTMEFFPEEGKYHYDGHSACKTRMHPAERIARKTDACSTCGRPVTVGVLSRVEELADRSEGFVPPGAIPYKSLIPLEHIIGDVFGVGTKSKRVRKEYDTLIAELGTELHILLDAPAGDLKRIASPEVAEGIMRVRDGKVIIEPGYDGEYGKIHVFGEDERGKGQAALF